MEKKTDDELYLKTNHGKILYPQPFVWKLDIGIGFYFPLQWIRIWFFNDISSQCWISYYWLDYNRQ